MERIAQQKLFDLLRDVSTPARPVYLVGGAVRDQLLNLPVHDLDFALAGGTRKLAQEVARRLNGKLYVMDEERDITRVVWDGSLTAAGPGSQKIRIFLDFAAFRAASLEQDLRGRDFSINAMAFDIAQPDRLIDPTGGLPDLQAKRIRACSPTSLEDDPVRVLRAIRQSLAFHFRIEPDTIRQIRAAAPGLRRVSAERLRDELFKTLEGRQVALAIRLLDQVGGLIFLLPELEGLKEIQQPASPALDAWEQTLQEVEALEQLYNALVGAYQEESVPDLTVGSAVLWLGRYRSQFADHYRSTLVPDRSYRALLFLAALYHKAAGPAAQSLAFKDLVSDPVASVSDLQKVIERAWALALSSAEIDRLKTIIIHLPRVHQMARDVQRNGVGPSRREIYRFFQQTGPAGVDICLLSLADVRGSFGVMLSQDIWQAELETCRTLLEAYWEQNEQVVNPPRLVSGDDLMKVYRLQPGPVVGRLIAAIREAQAAGEISSREEALAYSQKWLDAVLIGGLESRGGNG